MAAGAPVHDLPNWRKHSDYLEQYGRVHYPQDLLRFAAEAVEQQLLDKAEAVRFLGEELMLPGGIELGVFPADFWLRSVAAIESVVRACVQRYDVVREGYDARAWAFCVERLGSYLVLAGAAQLAGRGAAHVRLALGRPESLVAPIRRPAQPADGR